MLLLLLASADSTPTPRLRIRFKPWSYAHLVCHVSTCYYFPLICYYVRYLDLHEQHRTFTNASFGRQVDYLEYLGTLATFDSIPKNLRLTKPYRCVCWAQP